MDQDEILHRIEVLDEEYDHYNSYLNIMRSVINTSYAYDNIEAFRNVLIKDYDQSAEVINAIVDKLNFLKSEVPDDCNESPTDTEE